MNPADWGQIVGGFAAGGTVVSVVVRWAWRRFLHSVLVALEEVRVQVTPNGGSTAKLGDRVKRIEDGLAAIARDVRTQNGILLGDLVERTEGRRIIEEVPKADRTSSEQGYVDRLADGGH